MWKYVESVFQRLRILNKLMELKDFNTVRMVPEKYSAEYQRSTAYEKHVNGKGGHVGDDELKKL